MPGSKIESVSFLRTRVIVYVSTAVVRYQPDRVPRKAPNVASIGLPAPEFTRCTRAVELTKQPKGFMYIESSSHQVLEH